MTYITEHNGQTIHKIMEKVLDTIVIPDDKMDAVIEVVSAVEDSRYHSLFSVTVREEAMHQFFELAREVRRYMVQRGLSELKTLNHTLGEIQQIQRESPKEYKEQHERSRAAQALMQDAMNMAMAMSHSSLGRSDLDTRFGPATAERQEVQQHDTQQPKAPFGKIPTDL
ncbi:MAG: hypothetical protein OXD31_16980 [Chloroflexi bacterium]|nr:hypothetical protein [Chloroflexota bacterium]